MAEPVPNTALRTARQRRNLTQAELAEAVRARAVAMGLNLGCDAKRVGRWERGEVRCPTPVYRRVLCALFGVADITELGFVAPYAAVPSQTGVQELVEAAYQTGLSHGLGSRQPCHHRPGWGLGRCGPRPTH